MAPPSPPPPLSVDGTSGDGPSLIGPVVLLAGLLGWFFGMSPWGKGWLDFVAVDEGRSLIAENGKYVVHMGASLALVLVGTAMTLLTPPIGDRPRNDPDWRAFFRARNRSAGLLLLCGVPLALSGVVILVVLIVVQVGLLGERAPWGPEDLVQLAMAMIWLALGALTMWKAWVLMQQVPWERQADEPLPLDPGTGDPVGASLPESSGG